MRVLTVLILTGFTLLPATRASAAPDTAFLTPTAARTPWQIDWTAPPPGANDASAAPLHVPDFAFSQEPQPLHTAAVEHSDAYQMRARIHKIASLASLPLFASELFLGQSVYDSGPNGGHDAMKGAHIAVGAGLVSLFAVNSVTGVWNMFGHEGRQEKQGRALRLAHGLLMLAADVGFVATMATAPGEGEGRGVNSNLASGRSTHRAVAVTSIGLGTAGYLVMLLGNH